MIPGAMFINVLAGSLYGLWGTFCVIACVSTLGACLNYWLARLLVRVRVYIILHNVKSVPIIACIRTVGAHLHYCLAQLLVRVLSQSSILHNLDSTLAHILRCPIMHNPKA